MLQMGFSRDEIQEALANNRYDEVMATYLLLDERRQKLTVRLIFLCPKHLSCVGLQAVMIGRATQLFPTFIKTLMCGYIH